MNKSYREGLMTLGSLFDGIGGFPLAAVRNNIAPIWASEIEAVPVSITKRHFPDMKHLGDIRNINGREIEPVDVITFGSPCQDLSVAGKRAGLGGERSSLFMEAVRIIKEMRDATNGVMPRYCVYENVMGAFSTNKSEDFRIILEKITDIAGQGVSVPGSPQGERWFASGGVMGDGYSLAWRVLDAQYWGVPQRRRRIFLVADFGGGRAGEILFEPEIPDGNIEEGGGKGKRTAPGTSGSFRKTGEGYRQEGVRHIKAEGENHPNRLDNIIVLNDHGGDCINIGKSISPRQSEAHGNLPVIARYTADFGRLGNRVQMNTDNDVILQGEAGKTGLYCLPYQATVGSICSRDYKGVGSQYVNENKLIVTFTQQQNNENKEAGLTGTGYTVRRLTPTECERLQGFPDGWTEYGHDGQPVSDTARYKALGNSVAIPCVIFILSGISAQGETDAKVESLGRLYR